MCVFVESIHLSLNIYDSSSILYGSVGVLNI